MTMPYGWTEPVEVKLSAYRHEGAAYLAIVDTQLPKYWRLIRCPAKDTAGNTYSVAAHYLIHEDSECRDMQYKYGHYGKVHGVLNLGDWLVVGPHGCLIATEETMLDHYLKGLWL